MEKYTVRLQRGAPLSADEWRALEAGAVANEKDAEVRRALSGTVAELLENRPAQDRGPPPPLVALAPEQYARLRAGFYPESAAPRESGAGAPQKRSGKDRAGGKNRAQAIRQQNLTKQLDRLAADLAAAFPRTKPRDAPRDLPKLAADVRRFLSHDIGEVRCLALVLCIRACTGQATANESAVLELDVAVQRFLETRWSEGKDAEDPSRPLSMAPQAKTDLADEFARMRSRWAFDGVRLSLVCPRALWYTAYDPCLARPPVRTRSNQRATLEALFRLCADRAPFLLMNSSPPGSGKSALLAPIAERFARKDAEAGCELYICACQGPTGVSQFAQALIGASLTFSYVCLDAEALKISQQRRDQKSASAIYVGTPDAIERLLLTHEPDQRRGLLVMDEPTYGADVPGSPAGRAAMRLLAGLLPENRRVLFLGATLPRPDALPGLAAWFGRVVEVPADAESIQIACAVVTETGRRVLPHHGCRDAQALGLVAQQLTAAPFMARIITASDLVDLAARLPPGALAEPDLRARLNASAESLRPAALVRTAQELLQGAADLLAEDPGAVGALCTPPAETAPPPPLDRLAMEGAGPATMVVDTEPEETALRIGAPLLARMAQEGIAEAAPLYEAYAAAQERAARRGQAQERRRARGGGGGKRRSGGGGGGGLRDRHGAGGGAGADEADKASPETPHESSEEEAPCLEFPPKFQIGTRAHLAAFGGDLGGARLPAEPSLVPQLQGVPDVYQLLLLAGLAVLTNRGSLGKARAYQAEALRRAAAGQLALVVTDHTGCYGTNLVLAEVRLTPRFCAVASLQTVEQAGGRLGRVGLSYSGRLVLPDATAAALLADFHAGPGSRSPEAAHMEAAFAEAAASAESRKAELLLLNEKARAAPPRPRARKLRVDDDP